MEGSWTIDLLKAGGSLLVLFAGAELLLRGSRELGLRLRLSPLVVGLTIVACATSAPEWVVSVQAALQGAGGVAVGNVVGSNLANVGVILGLSALVYPLAVDRLSVRVDAPIMLGISAVGAWMLWDGRVERWEGCVLLALLVGYIAFRLRLARREPLGACGEEPAEPSWSWGLAAVAAAAGLALLAWGGDGLVGAGLSIAARLEVPEAFVALTMVALGTSLPELATSLVAAFRRQADVAVGNVLGSNIFNLTGVLGSAAVAQPVVSDGFHRELGAMLAMSVLLLPLARSGFRLQRWEGVVLLVVYGGTIWWVS